MRTIRQLGFTGAIVLLAGAPLGAQQPAPSTPPHGAAHGPMPHAASMPMMECPMMSAMMHGPAAALGAGTALGLTADQRTRLEATRRRLDAVRAPSMDSMRVIHAQLTTLAKQPALDEAGARAAFDRMGRVHTAVGLASLRASHEASEILTPVQRDSLMAIARRRMPQHAAMPKGSMPMGSMPMGAMCPMMQ
jgi:Spy/CpxP family protein refolding chaperone